MVTSHGSFSSLKPNVPPSKYPKLHGFINGDDPSLRTAETNWDDPPTTMGDDSAIQDVVYLSGCYVQLNFCFANWLLKLKTWDPYFGSYERIPI